MFGGPEVSYHQMHSARDWLSFLRTPYTTQNLQRKRRTDGESNFNSGDGTGQMAQHSMFMMMMMTISNYDKRLGFTYLKPINFF
jgi:hypothetical protein